MIKSLKQTWNLLSLDSKHPASSHASMVAAPLVIAVGVVIFVNSFLNIIIALVFGALAFISVVYAMGWSTRKEQEMIERRLDTKHLYPAHTPNYYEGAGKWIAFGHMNKKEFAKKVRQADPKLKYLDDKQLIAMVSHAYMIDAYSTRNSTPALKYASPRTKGAYPVTHIKMPYDYYVQERLKDET